ncbi:hypothetical protein QAD02_005459 [Eretmocerus hayati]|uniref:Uncharacterized protein n=1 Tax=Eretmocerus hayati TaxID=131215 RepID=A0ACC2NSW2_9HYME|nr:hypothetical protein QAD02_005459 [Eretmocerus hayati]
MIIYLLERGADPNVPYKDGNTAIYRIIDHMGRFIYGYPTYEKTVYSSYYPAKLLLTLFLQYGAEVNCGYDNLAHPFLIALRCGNTFAMKLLIQHGYEFNNYIKVSPPFLISSLGLGLFELLARADIFDLLAKDEDTETLLHRVIRGEKFQSLDKVKLLVELGSDVNNVDFEGHSILYSAVQILEVRPKLDFNLYKDLLRYLISQGAKVYDGVLEWQFQPIAEIIFRGDWEIVQFFIEQFFKIGCTLDQLKSVYPLPIASFNSRSEVIEGLLGTRMFDVDQKNHYGDTALHVTLLKGKGKYTELLLQWGANVNIKNNDGETALHCSAQAGGETIHYLLWKGADVNVRTNNNQLPLNLAMVNCKQKYIEYLISYISLLDHQGLDVDPMNFSLIQNLIANRKYFQNSKEELKLAQSTHLHDSVTVYDFLIGEDSRLVCLMHVEAIWNAFDDEDAIARFPIYGEQIKKRFDDAKAEYFMQLEAVRGLRSILKFDSDGFHLIYDTIINKLDKQGLVNLGKISC